MADDICSKLKELLKTDAYDIRMSKTPKYLSFFGICGKNIFIHKWDKSQETYPEKYLCTSYSEFDITGNPLECPFAEDTTFDNSVFVKQKTEEDCHAPLNVTEARHCLGISNLYLKPQLPVWVLTEPEGKDAYVLLGCEFVKGWCFQSWAKIQGMQAVTDNIKSMVDEHKRMTLLPDSQVNSKVTSIYETFDDSEIGSSRVKEVTLEVSWRKPSYEVPFDEADTSVIVKTLIGGKDNITSPMWNQILLLDKYLDTIVKWKTERQQQLPYQRDAIQIPSIRDVSPDSTKSIETLMDRVKFLLKASDHQSLTTDFPENKTKELKKTKEIIEAVASNQCSGQDFTYKLWTLLIDANSYQELASSMHYVFLEVKKQLVNPYILRNNKARLAQALHNARFDFKAELMFEPLELLMELGIEKMKYDYLYIFNRLQLVNRDQLAIPDLPSFSNVLSMEWESTVKSWLNWFARIHTVLDIVCLTEEKLGSNIGTLTSVCNVALKTYLGSNSPVMSIEDIISKPIQEIRASVKTKDVNDHIGKGCQFHKWLLNLTSSSTSRTVTSRYLLSMSLPFPESVVKKVVKEDSFENTVFPDETVLIYGKESLYYSAKLITVGDKFL